MHACHSASAGRQSTSSQVGWRSSEGRSAGVPPRDSCQRPSCFYIDSSTISINTHCRMCGFSTSMSAAVRICCLRRDGFFKLLGCWDLMPPMFCLNTCRRERGRNEKSYHRAKLASVSRPCSVPGARFWKMRLAFSGGATKASSGTPHCGCQLLLCMVGLAGKRALRHID